MKKLVDVSLRVLVSSALVLGTVPSVALAEGVDEAEDAIVALADAVGTDSNYIVDWTECGTCLWSIDSEGTLVVKPADGDEGYLSEIPWSNYKAKVRSVRFEGAVKAPWNFSGAFQDMTRLEKIDLTGLDTSNTQYLDCLFDGCSKLISIDLSVLDTSNVTDMWFMFYGCSSLTSVKLSGLDTSMVSNVGGMFKDCSSLVSFDASCFEGSPLSNLEHMFYGCSSLTSLDLTGLDTSKVTSMDHLFSGCSSLTSLDLSGLDTSKVANMDDMFSGCSSLVSLDLSSLDTSFADTMASMFSGCDLKEIKLGDKFSFCGFGDERLTSLPGGSWKSSVDGKSYASDEIPNNIAATYTLQRQIGDYVSSVDLSDEYWTGSAITKQVVLDGLTEGVDYKVEYSNNVDPGMATISITGMGDYAGTLTYDFNILDADYTCSEDDSSLSVEFSVNAADLISWYVDNSSVAVITSVSSSSVSWGATQSTQGTVELQPVGAGTTMLYGYAGSNLVCSYMIRVTPSTKVDISTAQVTFDKDGYTYTGDAITPAVTVKVDDATLTEGVDYSLWYFDNVGVGSGSVQVVGMGNYKGEASAAFAITPADASKAAVKADDQTWTGSALTPAPSVTLDGKVLEQGVDYDVAYSNNVAVGTAAVTVTFKGNYTGSAKGTFKINAIDASKATVRLADQTYTGKPLTPAPTVTLAGKTLAAGTDYDVSYSNNVKAGTATATVTFKGNYAGTAKGTFRISSASVTYQAHVQDIGWQAAVKDGATAGTSGQAKRVEALKVSVENAGCTGSIQIRAHVQDIGWQGWSTTGGTTGLSKRVEAMQLKLTGELAERYDVYYRVHAENIGWMGWAKDGESAGTEGYSLRLEAIQVVLVPKGGAAPGATSDHFRKPAMSVTYQAHVQDIGWQAAVRDGAVAGTSGQAKRVEALAVSVEHPDYAGGIQIRAHVQDIGWQGWSKTGGTTGQSKRVEAMQLRLTGELAEHYDVYYRVHAQNIGWMGWAKNGESAGTEGMSLRLEAIQVKLVPKGGAAPGSTANCFQKR